MTELQNWCDSRGIVVTETQLSQFAAYKENLLDWNKKINLTAITDYTGVWQKHFADSLTLLGFLERILPEPDGGTLIDVGTGAGFPGIPVKIMRPDISVTLLDSLRKRCVFLEDTIAKLRLDEIEAKHCRAEDFLKAGGNRHDICTARAVARLDKLVSWCLPLVKPGGYFIAMKGGDIEEELQAAMPAIKKAAARLQDVIEFELVPRVRRVLIVVSSG